MRVSILPILAVASSMAVVGAQGPPLAPGPASSINRLVNSVMGDMSSVASRIRRGFTRTFGNSRSSNVRPNQGFRNSPVDPAIQTNEIAPSRQINEDAPNAPGFGGQGNRRPLNRGPTSFSLRRFMDQLMGGMRNMLQGFNRRGGGPPGRRIAQPQKKQAPVQQSSHFQQLTVGPQQL
ncbi:hypothetical protein FHG87_004025 [Trinorchestia longiramus]|nr:hypothetical protein FHG87_004025 [Trinorchestia longiramus]